MSRHPLDISAILQAKGIELEKPEEVKNARSGRDMRRGPTPRHEAQAPEPRPQRAYRIREEFWAKLTPGCQRMLTSRAFIDVDFNPLLAELSDLSRVDEAWLRWAIPTYVNGLRGGPIRDWMEGARRERDLHYVLVGEHLRYQRDKRQTERRTKRSSALVAELLKVAGRVRDMIGRVEEHIEAFRRQAGAVPA